MNLNSCPDFENTHKTDPTLHAFLDFALFFPCESAGWLGLMLFVPPSLFTKPSLNVQLGSQLLQDAVLSLRPPGFPSPRNSPGQSGLLNGTLPPWLGTNSCFPVGVTDAPVRLQGRPYTSLFLTRLNVQQELHNRVSDLLIFTETGERPGRDGRG